MKRVGVGTVWDSGRHRCTMWHTWAYLGVGGGNYEVLPFGEFIFKIVTCCFFVFKEKVLGSWFMELLKMFVFIQPHDNVTI